MTAVGTFEQAQDIALAHLRQVSPLADWVVTHRGRENADFYQPIIMTRREMKEKMRGAIYVGDDVLLVSKADRTVISTTTWEARHLMADMVGVSARGE